MIGGKILAQGTYYDVTGGEALIGQTSHLIEYGKTLIDGTACTIDMRDYPTFETLFSTNTYYATQGRDSATAGVLSRSLPSWASVGDVWYSFYCCGSSLEICRIDYISSNSITRTRLKTVATQSSDYKYTTVSGTNLVTEDSIYSGCIIYLKFSATFSTAYIDYMFRNFDSGTFRGYYDSTSGTESTLRILQSTVNNSSTTCFVAFYSGGTQWSVSLTTSPLTVIAGNNSTRTAIMSSGSYYIPTANGSTFAGSRSYTFKRLKETW